ncbi:MAG: LptF/LptG family permease, partial [Stellaceae bacterium]
MTSLTRYILRQCFGVMIFVTAALSAAVWLAQSLRLVDLIVNRGLSIEVFLYLAALILPRFLDIVLPIGVFIAVLFTFNRMTAESELVVMRAAGLSPMALAKPVLILAAIAFAALMSLSLYFLPVADQAFRDMQFEIRNRFVSSLIQEG